MTLHTRSRDESRTRVVLFSPKRPLGILRSALVPVLAAVLLAFLLAPGGEVVRTEGGGPWTVPAGFGPSVLGAFLFLAGVGWRGPSVRAPLPPRRRLRS